MAGYAEVVQEAISAQQQMEPICTSIPQDKRIPSSDLGSQLRAIKQMIDGAQELGHNRQVFYVGIGGYDTHDNQVRRQDALMKDFAEAIAGLYKALEEDGLGDQVLTFTMSEFGRTMHDNARKGTDTVGVGDNISLAAKSPKASVLARSRILNVTGKTTTAMAA